MVGECHNQREDCPYYLSGCFASQHHEYWPKKDYRSSTEKTFRDLPENKSLLCRDDHDQLHFNEQPPEMPSNSEMIDAIAVSGVYLSIAKKRVMGLP